jgi:hypothetical protein
MWSEPEVLKVPVIGLLEVSRVRSEEMNDCEEDGSESEHGTAESNYMGGDEGIRSVQLRMTHRQGLQGW